MSICVDACLVVKWLTPEEGSDQAKKLLKKWIRDKERLIGPSLLDYEVGTTLRQKICRGLIHYEDLFPILDLYHKLDILLFHITPLVSQTLQAAATLDLPTIYDVSYLLTAGQQKATFVTADKRFYEVAASFFSHVKYYKSFD